MKDTTPASPETLFFDVYRQLNRGLAMGEASEALAQCSATAQELGKKATLTIKLTITPLKDHEGAVEITDTIETSLPKAKRKPRLLFATPEGLLTTERADQDKFQFERDATIVAGPHAPKREAREDPATADRKTAAAGS